MHVDGELRSNYSRNIYFKNNFMFVSPISMQLSSIHDATETATYQYVPILDSLKALFKDASVRKQFLNPTEVCLNVYKDFKDGKVFKNNILFNGAKPTLQIILYQDVFEVCNPLESSKGIHKILAVYYSLANLYAYNRSKVDAMQLVMLCEERFLEGNPNAIFRPLLNDLKILEHSGLDLGFDRKILGSVLCVLGDNLGSHWIGGFCTNFNASHFCRYCLVTKSDFSKDCLAIGPSRSESSYNHAVGKQEESHALHFQGVKRNSIMNELTYFHVCAPGLPPCLAHDLLEGIVQYDMMLYLNYLMSKNWFTLDFLNFQIENFGYCGHDKLSKPKIVTKRTTKLPGNASENWCFIRVFPLLVYSKIKDTDDPVWKLIINLRSILQIVVAFSLSEIQILHLKYLIVDYVKDRQDNFPSIQLRPKHHFLQHYPSAILKFGPLRNCSTLRFESKHSYFKRIVAATKNYVNVCFTLAMNHQRLQACLLESGLFPSEVQLHSLINPIFSNDILSVLSMQGFQSASCIFAEKLKFRGISHEVGEHIVLEKQKNDLQLGKVKVLFLHGEIPYAIYQACNGIYMPDVGLHVIVMNEVSCLDADISPLKCTSLTDIFCMEPVHAYFVNQSQLLCLKHAV